MIKLEEEVSPLVSLTLQNYSYSRLNTFDRCQLQYFYQYIVKIPQVYGMAATLGNIIHKALETTLQHGYGIDYTDLSQNYNAAIELIDPERRIPGSMLDEGREMLAEYANLNKDPNAKPLEYEKDFHTEMEFSVVIGRGRFNGYIDYILVDENLVTITDYKSGKWEIAKKNTPTDLQLGIYALVAKHQWPDKPIYAELYYLRSGNRKGHLFSDDDLSVVEGKLVESVEQIIETSDFKATSNERNCMLCSYAKDGTCSIGGQRLKKRGLLR